MFIEVTERRRSQFFRAATDPVMGFTDDELRAVATPTVIVPYYDRAHPDCSLRHAERAIPFSRLIDFAPERRVSQARHEASPERDVADQLVIAEILDQFIADLDASDGAV
jgi:hypothetical protein